MEIKKQTEFGCFQHCPKVNEMIATMRDPRKAFFRIFNKSATKATVKRVSETKTGQSLHRRIVLSCNKGPGKSVSGRRTGRIRPNCKSKLNSESFTPKNLNKSASTIVSDRNSTEMTKHTVLKLRRNFQLQRKKNQDIRSGKQLKKKKEHTPINTAKKVRIVLPSQRDHRDLSLLKSSPRVLLKKIQIPDKFWGSPILPLQPQIKTKEVTSSIGNVNNHMTKSSAPTVDFHTPEDVFHTPIEDSHTPIVDSHTHKNNDFHTQTVYFHTLEDDDYAINEFFYIKVTFQDIFLQVLRDPFKNMPKLIHEFHRMVTKIRSAKDIIPRLKCISRAASLILDDTLLNNINQNLNAKLEDRQNFSKNLKERIALIQNSDELDVDSKIKEINKLQEEFFLKMNPVGNSEKEKTSLKEAIDYLFVPAFSTEDQVCCCDSCVMKEIKCLCQVIFHQINGTRCNKYLFAEFRSRLNKLKSVKGVCPILKLILKSAINIKLHPMIKIGEKANSSVMKKDIEDLKNKINMLSTELKPLNNTYNQKCEENSRRKQAEEFKRKSTQMEQQRTCEDFIAKIETAELEKVKSILKEHGAGKQKQGKYIKKNCSSCPKREEQMVLMNLRTSTNKQEEKNLLVDKKELRRYEQTTIQWETQVESLTEEKKKLCEEFHSLNLIQPDKVDEWVALKERIEKQLERAEERNKAEEAMWVPFPDPSELGPSKPLEWTH